MSAPKVYKDALEKAGLKVIYQEIDDATNANASAGVPVFTGIMSAHPEIKLVITDHGNLTGHHPDLPGSRWQETR